jgi:hypothetical protein
MKTRSTFTKSLALIATGIGVIITAAFWPGGRVAAIGNPDISPVEFGLLGLLPGQTARLNAVSLGGPDTVGDPNVGLARRVTLAFDIYGISDPNDSPNPATPEDTTDRLTHLRFLERRSRVVTLRPGEGVSFDFTAVADGTSISAVMVGDVENTPNPGASRGPQPHIGPTLEVLEGGRTVFTHPALIKFFNPQPDPPGARKVPGV